MKVYNKYSDHLKNQYGEKVYKIPVHLAVTCPNRDGACGKGGCTFCGEEGAGFEMREAHEPIREQLKRNMAYIGDRYKAKRFIAYFQNYSNTYMPLQQFIEVLDEIADEAIVGIALSTRPDCIHEEYLNALEAWQARTGKDVCIELGLQTVQYQSLYKVNRGHTLGEYLDAVLRIKRRGFEVCTHLILNLPWDTMADVIENAKVMSALKIDYVKLHALYIVKNTKMADQYEKGEIQMISMEEYKERVITFLRYLDSDIVLQRLLGRAPEAYTVFANWDTSWWKIHDEIVEEMEHNGYKQGDLCDYLNGKAVKGWCK